MLPGWQVSRWHRPTENKGLWQTCNHFKSHCAKICVWVCQMHRWGTWPPCWSLQDLGGSTPAASSRPRWWRPSLPSSLVGLLPSGSHPHLRALWEMREPPAGSGALPWKGRERERRPARWWQNFSSPEPLWWEHWALTGVLIWMSSDAEWLLLAPLPPLCPLSWAVCTSLCLLCKQLFPLLLLNFQGSYYILHTTLGWVCDRQLFILVCGLSFILWIVM